MTAHNSPQSFSRASAFCPADDLNLDIIGDVHGNYDLLCQLLERLGYVWCLKKNTYIHPDGRIALFVGDLVDRGRENLAVVGLVQNMMAAGSGLCIMGNHEYNAVQLVTPHPHKPDEFIRPQTPENMKQQKTFSDELGFTSGRAKGKHAEIVDFFKTLPLYFIAGNLVVTHACFYPSAIMRLTRNGYLDNKGHLTAKGWELEAYGKAHPVYNDLKILIKGPDADYPFDVLAGRQTERLCFWKDNPQTVGDAFTLLPKAFQNVAGMAYTPPAIFHDIRRELSGFKGLFVFGHISLVGHNPKPLARNVICVDYGPGRHAGKMVAWRITGGVDNPHEGYFVRHDCASPITPEWPVERYKAPLSREKQPA